jgi:signal transduction histidine kinase
MSDYLFYITISVVGSIFFIIVILDLFLILRLKNLKINREKEKRISEINQLLRLQELNLIDATLTGQNKERQRIAQELHDGIGSNLARAKMHFSVMEKELDRLKQFNREQYSEMSDILEDTLKEVRRISHDMYGSTVIKFGLKVATQQLLDAVEKSYQIKVSLYSKNLPEMDYDIEISIYRIIQELLSNSLKHAEAKRIDVQLTGEQNSTSLTYEDNGKGFDFSSSKTKSGLGLLSIENRIQSLKGTFKIESQPGKGFVFFADIPVLANPI